jgi:hypothetical protein
MPVHVGFVEGKVGVGEVFLRLHPTVVLRSTCFPEKVGVNKNRYSRHTSIMERTQPEGIETENERVKIKK